MSDPWATARAIGDPIRGAVTTAFCVVASKDAAGDGATNGDRQCVAAHLGIPPEYLIGVPEVILELLAAHLAGDRRHLAELRLGVDQTIIGKDARATMSLVE